MNINAIVVANTAGLLAAPSNLRILMASFTEIQLVWVPPFTLNITNSDSELDTLRLMWYQIIILNQDTDEEIIVNTTYPEYSYHRTEIMNCKHNRFEFQVVAFNKAGKGNRSVAIPAVFKDGKS